MLLNPIRIVCYWSFSVHGEGWPQYYSVIIISSTLTFLYPICGFDACTVKVYKRHVKLDYKCKNFSFTHLPRAIGVCLWHSRLARMFLCVWIMHLRMLHFVRIASIPARRHSCNRTIVTGTAVIEPLLYWSVTIVIPYFIYIYIYLNTIFFASDWYKNLLFSCTNCLITCMSAKTFPHNH